MPASVFSPLSRGYGTWTGELHLAENDKGPGPSLPSLLPDDPYCHHSGVTIRSRAKSAVSAFSSKSHPYSSENAGRQSAWSEKPERELVLPKTYLTRKGAIVLFAAPDDVSNIELSERDKLYLKKAQKKLLKHRYVDYSNKIGSIHRLTQSVLAFGDDEYEKETTSVTDPDNKAFLKFIRQDEHGNVLDKHSQPGYNVDMYLNDLMSRSGTRPSTAAPILDWRSNTTTTELHQRSDSAISMDSPDLLSIDNEYLVKYLSHPHPPSTPTGDDRGRASPSRPRRMSADKLAASLKSGGFLGRQTIVEELDSMSEASSRPITPANSLIRPNTGYLSKRQLSRPPSRERYGYQKLSVIDQTLEEGSRESISVTPDIGAKSNKMSKRSASAASSHSQLDPHHSGIRSPEELDRSGTSGVDDNDDNEEEYIEDQDLADNEIREIEGKAQASMGEDNLHHLENIGRAKSRSVSQSRQKRTRSSSVLSASKQHVVGTPDVSEVAGGELGEGEDEYYLSEDAGDDEDYEEEEGGEDMWDSSGQQGRLTQPLMPSYNPVSMMEISLLSGGSGGGTFSLDATTADNVPADQVLVESQIAQTQNSGASVKSDRASTVHSSVSHTGPESRPPSIAEGASTSNVMDDKIPKQQAEELQVAEDAAVNEKQHVTFSAADAVIGADGVGTESPDAATQDKTAVIDEAQIESNLKGKERPGSAASSHSGVASETDDKEQDEKAKGDMEVIAASEQDANDDVIKSDEVVVVDEALDEASTVSKSTSDKISADGDTVTVQPLPAYLHTQGDQALTPGAPKSPSSVSSTQTQDLPPEPGVTEVHITPRSSAVSSRRTDPNAAGEADNKKQLPSQAADKQKETAGKTSMKTEAAAAPAGQANKDVKVSKPEAVITKPSPPAPTKQTKQEPTKPAAQEKPSTPPQKPTAESETQESRKKPPTTASHMTQAKKEPPKEKPPLPNPKASPAEKEKKKAEPVKEEKPKEDKKPEKAKTKKEVKPVKKEEVPEKKEFVKALDIKNIDQPEKPKEPDYSKELPPIPPPKENLLSDTKAEIARLFGNQPPKGPPVKKESAREKKDRLKRDIGPRVQRKLKQVEPTKTQEDKELDALEKKVMDAIGDSTSGIPVDEDGDGLTAEEMDIERQIMEQKMVEAEAKLKGKEVEKKDNAGGKGTPRGKGKGKKGEPVEEVDLVKKREELREAKRLDKQKRLEEAKRVEEELKKKEEEKKRALENAKARTKYIAEDVEEMKRQAVEAELAEEQARLALAEARRVSREDREKRRKDEQEKKKQEALQKREQERRRSELGRQREQDMLMKLASKEERLRMAEENRRRKEDLEEQAMVDDEEEDRLYKRQMQAEDGRIAEAERQSEEEALSRLVKDREDAHRKQRQMEDMQRRLADEEEQKRKEYEAEQARMEEAHLQKEEEDRIRREEERKRLRELQRIEDEAREKMKQEMQRRRESLLRRREQNVERRKNLDGLKTKQAMTKGWVFTYYVHWPRETYERRMGGADDKKKRGKSAPPAKTRPTQS